MPSLWGETIEEHRARVRGRLLDAFAALAHERGIDAVTLSAVAERAGIARSAVYNHFKDKHDVVLAQARRAMAEAVAQLESELDPGLPPAERLRRYVEAAFASFSSERAASVEVLYALDPAEQRELRAMLQPVRELLRTIIDDGMAAGAFAGDSPEELTRYVSAVVDGHRRALADGRLDPALAASTCTRLLVHGLAGPR